jgi:hypothetical protein
MEDDGEHVFVPLGRGPMGEPLGPSFGCVPWSFRRVAELCCCCSEGFVVGEVAGLGEDDAACDFDGVVGEAFVEAA